MDILQSTLDLFRTCSGLRVNYNKSEVLPLTHPVSSRWKVSYLFPLAQQFITYLGVKIEKGPSSLYNLNYPPLPKLQKAWMTPPISLFGRFPCLLYPLQTIPILLKHQDVQKLNKAIVSFLWCKKRPYIALPKLHLPKSEGGAGISDIRMYNLAYLLRYGLDWLSQSSVYVNYTLESNLVSPYHLSGILHCKM